MIYTIHLTLSNTIWLFFLIIGLWGIVRGIRQDGVDGSYFGALAVGEILFVIQAILGTILYIQGASPARSGIHILYGIFNIVLLPFVYGYTKGDDSNVAQWMYAFSVLFLFGTALRTIQTGI